MSTKVGVREKPHLRVDEGSSGEDGRDGKGAELHCEVGVKELEELFALSDPLSSSLLLYTRRTLGPDLEMQW